ncbi:uncharacterized protein TNCV_4062111 [Trichonephila clavipes]|nr:uncharacterized protein TNCV_4062111 [Trichonephila clavipes]
MSNVNTNVAQFRYTRALWATDHVILNYGQVTSTTPELAPPLLTTTPHQWEDVRALGRFILHRSPTRQVFGITGLELVTRPATIMIRSFELQESDSAILLDSTPILKEKILRVVRSLLTPSSENLRLDGYLEYPHAEKTLYLQTSMPPGFEPRPNGIAVSVTNLYTGWVGLNCCDLR